MHLLILGGTGFLGRWTTRAALSAGHEVTVLTRGNLPAEPGTRQLTADRTKDLSVLRGEQFDAVIDGNCYQVAEVDRLVDALSDPGHLVFVSTISALGPLTRDGMDEDSPAMDVANPAEPDYGEAKAMCERRFAELLGSQLTICRPGLIGGPGDHTDRATYWGWRASKGGDAIAPGAPDHRMQLIDARDCADLLVRLASLQPAHTVHAVGASTRWGDVVAGLQQAQPSVRWHWLSTTLAEKHEVQPWSDLPAWIPPTHAQFSGIGTVGRNRALADGLVTRPPHVIMADAWAWRREQPEPYSKGLDAEREAGLLKLIS